MPHLLVLGLGRGRVGICHTSCCKRPTVDLEIFVVKIFSWFAQTTKIKKTQIYFTTDNHYIVRTFLFAQFHSTASYFAQDGLFDTSISLELMLNAKQLFVQCRRNRLSLLLQYVPTALLGSLLHASKFANSCMVSTNAACKLCIVLAHVVSCSRSLNLGT